MAPASMPVFVSPITGLGKKLKGDHTLKILTDDEQEKGKGKGQKKCYLKEYHSLKAEFVNLYGLLSSCHVKQLELRGSEDTMQQI